LTSLLFHDSDISLISISEVKNAGGNNEEAKVVKKIVLTMTAGQNKLERFSELSDI
jgi:hypothetical protein